MSFVSARRVVAVSLLALCLGVAGPAAAIDNHAEPGPPSAAAMAVDVALVRPLSLVASVLGTGVFIVSLPFSLLGMNVDQADHQLVVTPLAYTFARPLGNFHQVNVKGVRVGD